MNNLSNFKLPIEYINHHSINSIIQTDLELPFIYENLIGNSMLLDHWSSYYTTDTQFLKDTQSHIKKIPNRNVNNSMLESYKKFKSETSFIEKYQYIGFKHLKHLNYSSFFLHGL